MMSCRVLLCLMALVQTPFVMAQTSPILATNPSERWVQLLPNGSGFIIVPVTINGAAATALVDTGFPNVVLNKRWANASRQVVRPLGSAFSVGGFQDFGLTDGIQLAVGGQTFPKGSMQVADFSVVEQEIGERFDIVIGASLIARTGMTIDYDQQRMRLSAAHRQSGNGKVTPLRFDPSSSRFLVTGAALGSALDPLLLDTGSDAMLTLTQDTYDRLRSQVRKSTDIEIVGGGGSAIEMIFDVPTLQLGPTGLTDILAEVEPANGFLMRNALAGSVGSSFLRRFNYSIDPGARELVLSPRMTVIAAESKSTVGIQGDYRSDRISITHVMSNSPAQRAGIRNGDEICSIDDRPVVNGWTGSPMRNWGTSTPGTTYRIKLCNGRVMPIVTAAFY